MAKKLTDKEKLARITKLVEQALYNIEHNKKDKNLLGGITRNLCQSYALIQTEKDDEFMITNLWLQLELKVSGVDVSQLALPKTAPGNDYELRKGKK